MRLKHMYYLLKNNYPILKRIDAKSFVSNNSGKSENCTTINNWNQIYQSLLGSVDMRSCNNL